MSALQPNQTCTLFRLLLAGDQNWCYFEAIDRMVSLISAFASMSHSLSVLSFRFIFELLELLFLLIIISILFMNLNYNEYAGHSSGT